MFRFLLLFFSSLLPIFVWVLCLTIASLEAPVINFFSQQPISFKLLRIFHIDLLFLYAVLLTNCLAILCSFKAYFLTQHLFCSIPSLDQVSLITFLCLPTKLRFISYALQSDHQLSFQVLGLSFSTFLFFYDNLRSYIFHFFHLLIESF